MKRKRGEELTYLDSVRSLVHAHLPDVLTSLVHGYLQSSIYGTYLRSIKCNDVVAPRIVRVRGEEIVACSYSDALYSYTSENWKLMSYSLEISVNDFVVDEKQLFLVGTKYGVSRCMIYVYTGSLDKSELKSFYGIAANQICLDESNLIAYKDGKIHIYNKENGCCLSSLSSESVSYVRRGSIHYHQGHIVWIPHWITGGESIAQINLTTGDIVRKTKIMVPDDFCCHDGIVINDEVYITTNNNVMCISLKTGALVREWKCKSSRGMALLPCSELWICGLNEILVYS